MSVPSLAVPTAWLEGCVRSHRLFEGAAKSLTDADVRAPSALPDWTRGHVVTHVARNADANRAMAEAARNGDAAPMYPGGSDQRTGDIDAGASRSVADLLADVEAAHHALEEAWDALTEETWRHGIGFRLAGPTTIADFVFLRWREVSIHTVDLAVPRLDAPEAWRSLDAAYLDEEWRWTTAGLAGRVPEYTTLVLAPGDRPARAFGAGPRVVLNEDPVPRALAWLTGRAEPPLALDPW